MPPKTKPRTKRARPEVPEQQHQPPVLQNGANDIQRGSRQHGVSSNRHGASTLRLNINTNQDTQQVNSNHVVDEPVGIQQHQRPVQQNGANDIQRGSRQHSLSSNRHGASTLRLNTNTNQDTQPVNSNHVADEPVGNKKKRGMGSTLMPKVWGQQPGKRIVVTFNDLGQPNDEKTASALAHFLGTIARNGRYCPLHYPDWRLMPKRDKDEMLRLVKGKFEIPLGHEPYILRSINKKWRSWKCAIKKLNFDPDVPIEQQLLEIPELVNEEQYETLVDHWMSDNAEKISQKNKQTRAQLEYIHRMGKRSYARLKEIMKKDIGRYPTRAELFKECYLRADGTSEAIREAIAQMEELAAQNLENANSSDDIHNPDDDFAKVMGKDKDGQLRLYGMGVTAADVYGEKPSRAALHRQAMEYKEKYFQQVEKFDALNAKVEELTAIVQGRSRNFEQPDVGSARVATPRGQSNSQSAPVASPNNHISSTSISRPMNIKVGSYVVLKSGGNLNEIIASGIVTKMSNIFVNGIELEHGFCEIIIQYQEKRDARLLFPHSHFQTIGDVLGVPIVWPLSMVALDEEQN